MTSESYQDIYDFLRHYPIELGIEEGIIFLQNGDETLGIKPSEDCRDKFKIIYLALDRRITHSTLKDCPDSIKDWYNKLHDLRDSIEGYVTVAYFESIFDFDTALEVCGFIGSRMVTNSKNLEGIVVN